MLRNYSWSSKAISRESVQGKQSGSSRSALTVQRRKHAAQFSHGCDVRIVQLVMFIDGFMYCLFVLLLGAMGRLLLPLWEVRVLLSALGLSHSVHQNVQHRSVD